MKSSPKNYLTKIYFLVKYTKNKANANTKQELLSRHKKTQSKSNFKFGKKLKLTGGRLTEIHLIKIVVFHLIESFN
jgi:hypothetical protein